MVETKWRDCDADGCDEPTPMDMNGIAIDDMVVCSPGCAKQVVAEMDDEPEELTLLDPQYAIDRGPLGLDSSVVSIERDTDESPEEIIDLYDELYPADEWRVGP